MEPFSWGQHADEARSKRSGRKVAFSNKNPNKRFYANILIHMKEDQHNGKMMGEERKLVCALPMFSLLGGIFNLVAAATRQVLIEETLALHKAQYLLHLQSLL